MKIAIGFPLRPNIKPWFLREGGWPAMVFMVFYGYLHYKLNSKQWYWQTICKPWFLRVGWLAMIFIAPSQPLNTSIGQPEMCLAVWDKDSGFSAGMESYCHKPMVLNCDLKEMNKPRALGCCFPTKRSKSSNSPFMGILMSFLRSTLTYQRKGKITMRFCVSSVNSVAMNASSVIQLLTFVCLRLFFTFHHLGYHIFYFFHPRTGQANLSGPKTSNKHLLLHPLTIKSPGHIPETPGIYFPYNLTPSLSK